MTGDDMTGDGCRCLSGGPLLPDPPPPSGGHGDVLLDLAERARRIEPFPPCPPEERDEALREMLDSAVAVARGLCSMCGVVDLRAAILERREIGIARYSQPLRYDDGRGLVDAAQEALDLCGYLAREIGEDAPR